MTTIPDPPAGYDPLARAVDYVADETSFGWFNLQFRGLTPNEAIDLLQVARKTIKAPIRGADGRFFVITKPRGGRLLKVTPTTAADYAKVLRQAVREWRRRNDWRVPTKRDLFISAGTTFGYTTYRGFQGFTAKLERAGYTWPDAYV